MRIRDCKNVYVSGSLLFCRNCKRVIGYVDWNDIYVLKDVRLLYVVPIEVRPMDGKQFIYFRLLDHGPQKRKCEIDIYSEPPFKKFKLITRVVLWSCELILREMSH